MKKILLIILSLISVVIMGVGCTKETPYVSYSTLIPAESWSGANADTYDAVASYLIINGYVQRGLHVETEDIAYADSRVIPYYESQVKNLTIDKKADIEKALKGAPGSPCTVYLDYNLYRGESSFVLLRSNMISIYCPAAD